MYIETSHGVVYMRTRIEKERASKSALNSLAQTETSGRFRAPSASHLAPAAASSAGLESRTADSSRPCLLTLLVIDGLVGT